MPRTVHTSSVARPLSPIGIKSGFQYDHVENFANNGIPENQDTTDNGDFFQAKFGCSLSFISIFQNIFLVGLNSNWNNDRINFRLTGLHTYSFLIADSFKKGLIF